MTSFKENMDGKFRAFLARQRIYAQLTAGLRDDDIIMDSINHHHIIECQSSSSDDVDDYYYLNSSFFLLVYRLLKYCRVNNRLHLHRAIVERLLSTVDGFILNNQPRPSAPQANDPPPFQLFNQVKLWNYLVKYSPDTFITSADITFPSICCKYLLMDSVDGDIDNDGGSGAGLHSVRIKCLDLISNYLGRLLTIELLVPEETVRIIRNLGFENMLKLNDIPSNAIHHQERSLFLISPTEMMTRSSAAAAAVQRIIDRQMIMIYIQLRRLMERWPIFLTDLPLKITLDLFGWMERFQGADTELIRYLYHCTELLLQTKRPNDLRELIAKFFRDICGEASLASNLLLEYLLGQETIAVRAVPEGGFLMLLMRWLRFLHRQDVTVTNEDRPANLVIKATLKELLDRLERISLPYSTGPLKRALQTALQRI